MKARELLVEPTAWQCSVCLDGEDEIAGEPKLFHQLVQFQETSNSVIFAKFDLGPQYICEICELGHVLCRGCADGIYFENDPPKCPICRGPFLHPPSARTLPVFDRTTAEKLATEKEQAMVLQKHNLVAQHAAIVARQPSTSTSQETLANANLHERLSANALLLPMLGRQRRTQALQDESRLLRDFLDPATPAGTYLQLLFDQTTPTEHVDDDVEQALQLEFHYPMVMTQDMHDKAVIQMQIDVLNAKLHKIQSARPYRDYKHRLSLRDPQWQQRIVRNHNLPAPLG